MQFYVSEGPKIFKKIPFWTSFRSSTRSKYSQDPLRIALQTYFEDKLISDSTKRLVIPSYNLAKDEVYIFKTPHHPRLTTDGKVPMWKAALATSAAPTYFPCCEHVDGMRLVDGGLWANNTNSIGRKSRSLDRGGWFQWRRMGVDAALRGQSHGVQGQAQLLLTEDRAKRLDPMVPDGLFALDKLSEKDLLAEASHEARKFAPYFKKVFGNHKAEVISFRKSLAA